MRPKVFCVYTCEKMLQDFSPTSSYAQLLKNDLTSNGTSRGIYKLLAVTLLFVIFTVQAACEWTGAPDTSKKFRRAGTPLLSSQRGLSYLHDIAGEGEPPSILISSKVFITCRRKLLKCIVLNFYDAPMLTVAAILRFVSGGNKGILVDIRYVDDLR